MESKELGEVILPVQLLESMAIEAEEITKEKSKGGSNDFALGFHHGYFIGATSYAPWMIKYNDLKARYDKMEKLVSKLIERFEGAAEMADQDIDSKLIKRAKKALKEGESNNPAPVQGEKEVGNE